MTRIKQTLLNNHLRSQGFTDFFLFLIFPMHEYL